MKIVNLCFSLILTLTLQNALADFNDSITNQDKQKRTIHKENEDKSSKKITDRSELIKTDVEQNQNRIPELSVKDKVNSSRDTSSIKAFEKSASVHKIQKHKADRTLEEIIQSLNDKINLTQDPTSLPIIKESKDVAAVRKEISTQEADTYDSRCYCSIIAGSNDASGITNFSFNSINNSSKGEPFYSDFTEISTTVVKGQEYELSVRVNTAGNWTQYVRVWIDWNNNCVFDAGEEYNLGSVTNHLDGLTSNSPLLITIPETATTGTTGIRVRTRDGAAPTACSTHDWTEAEDYTLKIVDTDSSPAANFSASENIVMGAAKVKFSDLSDNRPNQWQWSFPGGIPSSSEEQHPEVVYMTPGVYEVSLIASNSYGSNTETKTDYIFVQDPASYEEVVVIEDDLADYFSWVFPLGWLQTHRYMRSAAIYTPGEIGQAGVIEFLSWYTEIAQGNRSGKIYLKHFYDETFSSQTSWNNIIDGATIVWEGDFTNPEAWTVFELNNSFLYNGTDNLLIMVEIDAPDTDNNSAALVQEKANTMQIWYSATGAPTANGELSQYRPVPGLIFSDKIAPPTSSFSNPVLYDGFENHQDFDLNFSPWTFIDDDRGPTYGIADVTFPNAGYTGSFIVFNPSQTDPPLGGDWEPYSGNKYAACFSTVTDSAPNDDWLITHLIKLENNSSLSFYAKSVTADFGLERFRVGVSTAEPIPADFTIISTGSYLEAPDQWTKFDFDLSAYDNQEVYVAIHCVSNDAFVFMIDDFVVHTEGMDIDIFEGESAFFYDTSVGNPEAWVWDLPGAVVDYSIDRHVSMQYNVAGTYDVSLTTANIGGSDTHTKSLHVNVSGRPPLAGFYATNFEGFINDRYQPFIPQGGSVDFIDNSEHVPTSWNWSLDSGSPNSSVLQNPLGITYNNQGRFDVDLTVQNNFGTDDLFAQRFINVGCCDYITNILPWDNPTYYGLNVDGFLPGHNDYQNVLGEYEMTAYAEQFDSTHPGEIDKVDLLVVFADGDSDVIITVWDDDNGLPGNVIGSKTLPIRDFTPLIWNEVVFDSTIVVNGSFYIGYQLTYDYPHDFDNHMFLVAMMQDRGFGMPESIYATFDNQWNKLDDLFGGLASSLAIIPYFCYEGAVPIVYNINATAGDNGNIIPAGNVEVPEGESQLFTFSADTGYHVDSVFVDGVNVEPADTYEFTNVWDDHSIHATFALNIYEIRVTADPYGTITPEGNVSVSHGGNAAFTISPDEGYEIYDVKVNGVSVGTPDYYEFVNVTQDQSFEVNFTFKTYSIFASSGDNGVISPAEGEIVVSHGANSQFSIIPDDGYYVGDVLVDSITVGAVTSYQFLDVTSNHSIHAIFTSSNIPGDVNEDTFVDVRDIVWMVKHINDNPPEGFIFLNGDINTDNIISVNDLTLLINIVMGGRAEAPTDDKIYNSGYYNDDSSGPNPGNSFGRNIDAFKKTDFKHSLTLANDTIILNSEGKLTALHFVLLTEDAQDITSKMLIPGYTLSCNAKEDQYSCVIYSMSLTPFPGGEVNFIEISGLDNDNFKWGKIDAADVNHNSIIIEGL